MEAGLLSLALEYNKRLYYLSKCRASSAGFVKCDQDY
jgi:hypothetical protein